MSEYDEPITFVESELGVHLYNPSYMDEGTLCGSCPGFDPRGHTHDYRDTAEFEARVAAELATARMEINWGEDFSCCPPTMTRRECSKGPSIDCQWCHLKYARIAVEAEMEAENGPVF